MRIFGKKEEDLDEEDILDEDDPAYTKASSREGRFKKIRDLQPENKKKRQEPVKPWGKRERLLVLGVLLITILTSGILALTARNYKLPNFPRLKISIPQIDLNIFGEKTIILEGNKTSERVRERESEREKSKAKKIQDEFKNQTSDLSGLYAFCVINLKSGYVFGVNEEEIMQAASLIKLPVLSAIFRDYEDGKIDLDEKYKLKDTDKIAGSGSLAGKPAGTEVSFRDLAKLMGKQSDNTAFNIVRKKLGDRRIEIEIERIGMEDTSLEENKTTPADVGRFFQRLWNSQIVSAKSRDEILGFLTDTIYENWLVAGIPEGTRVAHKYGREVHVVNDAGIVYAKDPFILVIMTDGVVEREADEVIPKITKMVYEEEIAK